jgi:hypothetical protein
MSDVGPTFAFGAGTFVLGMVALLALLFAASSRHGGGFGGEGCLGKVLVLLGLVAAILFFVLAVKP